MRGYMFESVFHNLLKMFLVTGGWTGYQSYLDSTEIFDPDHGSWTVSLASLPSPSCDLRSATIDNRVLIFGIQILNFIVKKLKRYKIF